MKLEKPPGKNWGVTSINPDTIQSMKYKVRLSGMYHPDYLMTIVDSRDFDLLSTLKSAGPFIQCDSKNYVFIEFWSNEDKCLEAAFALAELINDVLEMD